MLRLYIKMSADIRKEAVFDDRIVQSAPRYAVEKGALSLTNAPFNAIASTASQMTFNVYVPSENVFVDRALRWGGEARFNMSVVNVGGTGTATTNSVWNTGLGYSSVASGCYPIDADPVIVAGADFSLQQFPLNYLNQTMTATINDTTSVINSQDVLLEVMRLTDYKKNKKQRTCPTMMDKYQANYLAMDNMGAVNAPTSGYENAVNIDVVPNGAFPGFFWCKPDGSRVAQSGADSYAVSGGGANGLPLVQWFWNGVPVSSATVAYNSGSPAVIVPQTTAQLYWSFYSVELLTLSPFVFANDQEHDTGLFGINNIQLIMNFKSGTALNRILKTQFSALPAVSGSPLGVAITTGECANKPQILPSSLTFNTGASSVWASPVLNVQFLTPSLDVPLPPKSVVPYMEFPRYITQSQNGTLAPFGQQGYLGQLQSQTITLPQIPDLLIIYVKATQVPGQPDPADPSYCDAYLPIASPLNSSTKSPLSINFDNFSGLLSSHTAEELYGMSVENGLDMDYPTWCGLPRASTGGAYGAETGAGSNPIGSALLPGYPTLAQYPPIKAGSARPSVGGFLVLKPSKDITLQSGQAPSLVGNFTLQFNLQVVNTYPFQVQPTLYVITANSGFFESIRGSSRIIKGVLSEQDIISAPVSSAQTHEGLRRLVGGAFSFGSLANAFNKAKEVYEKTKPAISAVKGMLGDEGHMGTAKGVLGKLGYGGTAGGGMAGSGSSGGRKNLSQRLM